jgi:hypothetical protein
MQHDGKYQNETHRSFKGVTNLPVKYANTTSAWITASVTEGDMCNWAIKEIITELDSAQGFSNLRAD